MANTLVDLSVITQLLEESLADLADGDFIEIGVLGGTEPNKFRKASVTVKLTADHIALINPAARGARQAPPAKKAGKKVAKKAAGKAAAKAAK